MSPYRLYGDMPRAQREQYYKEVGRTFVLSEAEKKPSLLKGGMDLKIEPNSEIDDKQWWNWSDVFFGSHWEKHEKTNSNSKENKICSL